MNDVEPKDLKGGVLKETLLTLPGLADYCRAYRKKKNISSKKMAKIIGISPTDYCYFERKNRRPSNATIEKILACLGYTEYFLLYGPETDLEKL